MLHCAGNFVKIFIRARDVTEFFIRFWGIPDMDLIKTMKTWSVQDSADVYNVRGWGKGYFGINAEGNVSVSPDKNEARSIDLKKLVDELIMRGINLPVLVRFTDILKHRVGEIHDAFKTVITENGVQRKIFVRLPDQGEPAAACGGRNRGVWQALWIWPGGGEQAGAFGGAGGCRTTGNPTARLSATVLRTTNLLRW